MTNSELYRAEPPTPGPKRAAFAAGAAVSVLVGGGVLLGLATNRSVAPVVAAAPVDIVASAGGGDFGALVWPDAGATAALSNGGGSAAGAPDRVRAAVIPAPPPQLAEPPKPSADPASHVDRAAPRLKPPPAATGATSGADAVLSLATRWLAGEDERPPPFFFADDLVADRAPPPALAVAYSRDIARPPRDVSVSLSKGETFIDALRRAGVRAADRNEAAYAFGKLYDLRMLRPGQSFELTVAAPNKTLFELISLEAEPALHLIALDYNADPEKRIKLARTTEGSFSASVRSTPLTTRLAAVRGRIDGSLYLSAKRQGAPDEVIAGLAQMFAYDVDFQREIFGGDEFEAIFEVRYDETGKLVAGGEVLYGRLKWRGRSKEKGYYRFANEAAGRADYFDAAGESARRLLMKTPIDGARLSSGFGTRRHPILGYAKAHKGVDFAASPGTPIMAAGDGVVERAGPYGTFGNYVRIRHAQGYKTAYAHMNSIKKGVAAGARVRQGEVIGTVGSTGRSTGPHLHYEVHLKDNAVNPQSLKIATGYELGGKELARFRQERDRIDAMRLEAVEPEQNLVAENAKNRAL